MKWTDINNHQTESEEPRHRLEGIHFRQYPRYDLHYEGRRRETFSGTHMSMNLLKGTHPSDMEDIGRLLEEVMPLDMALDLQKKYTELVETGESITYQDSFQAP